MTHADYAILFKVMADETRLRIITMLAEGELCACEILEAFSITQPTLSYHMKILTESGLVHGRKDGAWMRYTLNRPLLDDVRDFLGADPETVRTQKGCAC